MQSQDVDAQETEAEFQHRLCRVIAQADTTFFDEDYVWRVLPSGMRPSANALACVSDGTAWFEFVPAGRDDTAGRFRVVCFKFSEQGPSAIGFVAWLHTHLRLSGRTGAIVICGKDSRDSPKLFQICQGVMDYWACPVGHAADRFLNVIRALIESGKAPRHPPS